MIIYDDDLGINLRDGTTNRPQAMFQEMLDIIIDDDDTEVDRPEFYAGKVIMLLERKKGNPWDQEKDAIFKYLIKRNRLM